MDSSWGREYLRRRKEQFTRDFVARKVARLKVRFNSKVAEKRGLLYTSEQGGTPQERMARMNALTVKETRINDLISQLEAGDEDPSNSEP